MDPDPRPEALGVAVGRLPQAVEEPLFDAEQIKTLLKEGGGMMFVYQPSALMATVPDKDRTGVLDELWKKVSDSYKQFRSEYKVWGEAQALEPTFRQRANAVPGRWKELPL